MLSAARNLDEFVALFAELLGSAFVFVVHEFHNLLDFANFLLHALRALWHKSLGKLSAVAQLAECVAAARKNFQIVAEHQVVVFAARNFDKVFVMGRIWDGDGIH